MWGAPLAPCTSHRGTSHPPETAPAPQSCVSPPPRLSENVLPLEVWLTIPENGEGLGCPLTFRNTPSTASPSGCLTADPKSLYLVFQWTRCSCGDRAQ